MKKDIELITADNDDARDTIDAIRHFGLTPIRVLATVLNDDTGSIHGDDHWAICKMIEERTCELNEHLKSLAIGKGTDKTATA